MVSNYLFGVVQIILAIWMLVLIIAVRKQYNSFMVSILLLIIIYNMIYPVNYQFLIKYFNTDADINHLLSAVDNSLPALLLIYHWILAHRYIQSTYMFPLLLQNVELKLQTEMLWQ